MRQTGVEKIVPDFGYEDFRWIEPEKIVVSQWVRMKCQFGCGSYGRVASCPPNGPSIAETREFFNEYSQVLVFRFHQQVEADSRHGWSKKINMELLKLEWEIFLTGFRKAFLLFMDNCAICADCMPVREECKVPQMSRPSPEGLGGGCFCHGSECRLSDRGIDSLRATDEPLCFSAGGVEFCHSQASQEIEMPDRSQNRSGIFTCLVNRFIYNFIYFDLKGETYADL